MASAIEKTTRIDAQILKQLSRMYEAGISIKDISEELKNGSADGEEAHKAFGLPASAD
jgi:DNA-binding transcriptional MerR regulator